MLTGRLFGRLNLLTCLKMDRDCLEMYANYFITLGALILRGHYFFEILSQLS